MAGPTVSMGAMVKCAMGAAPSPLVVPPLTMTMTDFLPAASIFSMIPFMNVEPFGVCMTPSNPMVAAATAAALGVLTPMPCIPVPVSPWIPTAPNVMVGFQPVLTQDSTTFCAWGGPISILFPGEVNVMSI